MPQRHGPQAAIPTRHQPTSAIRALFAGTRSPRQTIFVAQAFFNVPLGATMEIAMSKRTGKRRNQVASARHYSYEGKRNTKRERKPKAD